MVYNENPKGRGVLEACCDTCGRNAIATGSSFAECAENLLLLGWTFETPASGRYVITRCGKCPASQEVYRCVMCGKILGPEDHLLKCYECHKEYERRFK